MKRNFEQCEVEAQQNDIFGALFTFITKKQYIDIHFLPIYLYHIL